MVGTSNGVANFSYSYDGVGNPLTRADGNSGLTETFTYDTLNRLTQSSLNVSPSALVKNFTYDSIGNLLTKSDVGYAYPAPGVARPYGVVSIDGETVSAAFTYDANGNQTNATGIGRIVAYNASNRAASVTQGSLALNFADDVDHQRYKQTIMQGVDGHDHPLSRRLRGARRACDLRHDPVERIHHGGRLHDRGALPAGHERHLALFPTAWARPRSWAGGAARRL